MAHGQIHAADLGKRQSRRIDACGILIHAAHRQRRAAGQGQFEGAATARTHGSLRTVEHMSVLPVGGLEARKRTAGISRILVLHTRLVHDNGIARRVERLAIEQGIQGRRTILGQGKSSSSGYCKQTR